MIVRPQQRQARQHKELIEGLEVGDDVLTSAGIYGTVLAVDDDTIEVEIADGVEVTMSRKAVIEVAVTEVDEVDEVESAPDDTPAEGDEESSPDGGDSADADH
jgi:preprotein translocase subunit YajC